MYYIPTTVSQGYDTIITVLAQLAGKKKMSLRNSWGENTFTVLNCTY